MKRLIALALTLAIILTPSAFASIGNEEFTPHDFGDFTMSLPAGWENETEQPNQNQTFFFGGPVHKYSSGALMVLINDPSDVEVATEDDALRRYSRAIFDMKIDDYFYHDFYIDDTYCWFFGGDMNTYKVCGFIAFRNQRDYIVLLINPDSNTINNSWRMNEMIDSIEWVDQP